MELIYLNQLVLMLLKTLSSILIVPTYAILDLFQDTSKTELKVLMATTEKTNTYESSVNSWFNRVMG